MYTAVQKNINTWLTLTENTKSISFSAKVCGGAAYIALSQFVGNYESSGYLIELVEATSKYSHIFQMGHEGILASTASISTTQLCGNDGMFWISWENTRIEVGVGLTVGMKPVMTATMPEVMQINGVGFGLQHTASQPGRWMFLENPGMN